MGIINKVVADQNEHCDPQYHSRNSQGKEITKGDPSTSLVKLVGLGIAFIIGGGSGCDLRA